MDPSEIPGGQDLIATAEKDKSTLKICLLF